MSFNAKDMTRGRSDCVHAYPHVQPDRQYHALLPVYFFLDTRWSGFMGKK